MLTMDAPDFWLFTALTSWRLPWTVAECALSICESMSSAEGGPHHCQFLSFPELQESSQNMKTVSHNQGQLANACSLLVRKFRDIEGKTWSRSTCMHTHLSCILVHWQGQPSLWKFHWLHQSADESPECLALSPQSLLHWIQLHFPTGGNLVCIHSNSTHQKTINTT